MTNQSQCLMIGQLLKPNNLGLPECENLLPTRFEVLFNLQNHPIVHSKAYNHNKNPRKLSINKKFFERNLNLSI